MRFCVIKSRTIKISLGLILTMVLLAISFNGVGSAQVFFGYNTKKLPVYSVETTEKKVAISFDAAWGADKTEEILEVLKEYNATATFFLVGFWVDEHPELVRKISESGMEIGCHSSTHPDFVTLSQNQMISEISETNQKIKSIIEKDVNLFRCPYGSYNNNVIESVESLDMLAVQWDVDSLDWKGLSAQNITTRIVDNVKSGSIILCHNNADNIVAALTMVLDRLTMQGYEVVSVGELVYTENFSIDRNGVQHKSENKGGEDEENLNQGETDKVGQESKKLEKQPIT